MNKNIVHKHLQQMKLSTDEMKTIAYALSQAPTISQVEKANHVASLEKQLIVLGVYIDDALDKYEWQHNVWEKIKNDFTLMGLTLLGVGIGASLAYFLH